MPGRACARPPRISTQGAVSPPALPPLLVLLVLRLLVVLLLLFVLWVLCRRDVTDFDSSLPASCVPAARRRSGPPPRRLSSSWAEAMGRFERDLRARGMSEESIRTRLAHVRTLALASSVGPGEITGSGLLQWAGQQRWQRETRHAYYNSFQAFFGLVRPEDSPAAGLPRIRRPVGTPRPIPEELLSQALLRAEPRTRAILVLAGQAGLRRAEIAQVRVDDLSSDGRTWYLEVRGKGGRTRTIPVAASVAAMIRHECSRQDSEWLFPSPVGGAHLTPGHVSKLAARVLPVGWSLHTLRHRFATVAYEAGHDILAVRELLGHASVSTTQRYTRIPSQALVEAVNHAASCRTRERAGADEQRDAHVGDHAGC